MIISLKTVASDKTASQHIKRKVNLAAMFLFHISEPLLAVQV